MKIQIKNISIHEKKSFLFRPNLVSCSRCRAALGGSSFVFMFSLLVYDDTGSLPIIFSHQEAVRLSFLFLFFSDTK